MLPTNKNPLRGTFLHNNGTRNRNNGNGNNPMETLLNDSMDLKKCAYPSCENKILYNAEFEYCEVCRSITLRNTLALLLDPCSPLTDRSDFIWESAFHNMRPDEKINFSHKIESAYLKVQKELKSHQLEEYRRSAFQAAMETVHEERHKPKAPKAKAAGETKRDRKHKALVELLGGEKEAARLLGKVDVSDL